MLSFARARARAGLGETHRRSAAADDDARAT
jgi:hypothetical protein